MGCDILFVFALGHPYNFIRKPDILGEIKGCNANISQANWNIKRLQHSSKLDSVDRNQLARCSLDNYFDCSTSRVTKQVVLLGTGLC